MNSIQKANRTLVLNWREYLVEVPSHCQYYSPLNTQSQEGSQICENNKESNLICGCLSLIERMTNQEEKLMLERKQDGSK